MRHRFDDAVEAIMNEHPEYFPEAYGLLAQSFEIATERFHKDKDSAHLSAEELYLGFVTLALEEYGPLAGSVLSHWGITTAQDLGKMVYYLIEQGALGKQPSDSPEQFDTLKPLSELLEEPYVSTPSPES